MRPSEGIALVLMCVVAAAVADEPKPCCVPKKLVIGFDQLYVDKENGKVTNTLSVGRRAYDAENELVSQIVTTYNAEGQTEETKTIEIYPQGAKYVIKNGVCTKEALGHDFSPMCVPAIATHYETVKIGLGEYEVDGFKLAIPYEGYNFEVRFGFGREKCIPYQFGIQNIKSGTSPAGPAVNSPPSWLMWSGAQSVERLSESVQFYDYADGIKDPDFWFKVPPECKQPDAKQKIDAKKMADKLRNLLGVDKTFSVY